MLLTISNKEIKFAFSRTKLAMVESRASDSTKFISAVSALFARDISKTLSLLVRK